ncbi:MAG: hypothetical protein ACAI44_36430 [Candidatus Sericytochromatia bacterium]
MKNFSHKHVLPLLASALSLSLVACGPNPGQTTPSPQPSTSASAPDSPNPSASSPEASSAALTFRLQGDASLKNFSVMQAAGVCLADIKSAKTTLTLPAAPGTGAAAALQAQGVSVDGATLTVTSPVANLDALIAGIEVMLPALPTGNVSGETMLLNAGGQSLGSIKFSAQLQTGGSTVSVLLKPIAGTASTPGCPMLSADLTGASLVSLSGGLMLPVTVPSPTPSPQTSANPSATPTPAATSAPTTVNLPNPRNLQVVARSTDSLTLLWDFATLTGAHSYNLFLNGSKVASDITSNTHAFGGLSPNTTYTLGVQTVNASGVSEIVSVSGTTTTTGSVGVGNFSGGGSDTSSGGSSSGSGVTINLDPDPVAEFNVNAYTIGQQYQNDAAMDADGDYVVVWKDDGQGAILAQRFNEDSEAQGDPITVYQANSFPNQSHPSVAMDDSGDFVVTWTAYEESSFRIARRETYPSDIYARRYKASGTPKDSAFLVNTYTTNTQVFPDVAVDSDGDFVIVWENNYDSTSYNTVANIHGQRYSSSGSARGDEFVINEPDTNGGNWDHFPAVAMDQDGDFVVVWPDYDQDAEISDYLIRGRRYSKSGSAKGDQFTVTAPDNFVDGDKEGAPDVAMDHDGNFVVAWTYDDDQDGKYSGIFARRYSSTGSAKGDEFQVNTYTSNEQKVPTVGMDAEGDFVIAWRSLGQDGDNYGIFAQRYKSSGREIGSEYQVNEYTGNNQNRPKLAMADDGNFIVTWFSDGQLNSKDVFAGNGLE